MNRVTKIVLKTVFALLGFSAIVTELATLLERDLLNVINFFSYFTIQTNILVVVSLLLSAYALASRKSRFGTFRSAVTVYILVVGIGFSFLLAGLENTALTAVPWDNVVLHYIMPAVILLDLIIDRPNRAISFRKGLTWLVFPLLYLVYSLVRGWIIGWYPYPFLNPGRAGIEPIIITSLGLLALGLVLVAVVTFLSKPAKR